MNQLDQLEVRPIAEGLPFFKLVDGHGEFRPMGFVTLNLKSEIRRVEMS